MSYIIISNKTGQAVAEVFDSRIIQAINTDKYRVEEAGSYLCRINREIAPANNPDSTIEHAERFDQL